MVRTWSRWKFLDLSPDHSPEIPDWRIFRTQHESRIVCFHPFRSSVFTQLYFKKGRRLWSIGSSAFSPLDRPLWPGSSALTHRSSALAQKIVCFEPKIVCFRPGSSALTHRSSAFAPDRLLSSFWGSSAFVLLDRLLSTVLKKFYPIA